MALGMTVREMLARIDSAEIVEWAGYFKLIENPELMKPKQDAEAMKVILSSMTKERSDDNW